MTITRVPRVRRLSSRGKLSTNLWAIVFAVPALLVFVYFSWIPIVRGVVMSFQKTNLVDAPSWVGLSNFSYVLTDPLLPTAIENTLLFAGLSIVFGFPLPLFLAVVIGERRKWGGFYAFAAYLPVVIPPVINILLWKLFLDPDKGGLFNTALHAIGLGPFAWLNSPTMALPSIVLEVIWSGFGATLIIYLAALGSVQSDLYEAAELDGAGIWSRVWHVSLPQLRGVMLLMLTLQVIGISQLFTEPFLFTGGGPVNATTSILLMIYNYAFVNGDYGAAAALSVVLGAALSVISALYWLATRSWSTR